MTRFDDELREALSADDEAFLKELEEKQSIFSMLGNTMRGPQGYWSKFAIVFAGIFALIAIYCGYQAFQAETDRLVTLWATGVIVALVPNGLLRLWLMNRVNHLAVLSELKKIELRLIKMETERV